MLRGSAYLILSTFGDGKFHSVGEASWLCLMSNKLPKDLFSKLFKKAVEYNWLRGNYEDRSFFKIPFERRQFKLTRKGDECFRLASIYRGGDFDYYKYFDRTASKEMLERFGPKSSKKE